MGDATLGPTGRIDIVGLAALIPVTGFLVATTLAASFAQAVVAKRSRRLPGIGKSGKAAATGG